MAFVFKKQIFGFLDLLRFKKLVPNRRRHLEEGASSPIPAEYAVNRTAKILHPGYQSAKLVSVRLESLDTKTYTLETERPIYFRAGQYVTLGCPIGGSVVSRPYALSSAPREGLQRKISVTVKKTGFFSGYLFDNAKEGDLFTVGDPSGEFFYEPIKDAGHIVGIAGGSGITPFYSMAQAIADGTETCRLTLLYGAKKEEDLIFRTELDALQSDRFRVIYVLSDEKREGYEHGFIGADLIRAHASGDFTVMMCGPGAMYAFVDRELQSFGLERRRVKKEANCVGTRDVKDATYRLTVHICDQRYEIPASSRETVLVAMERAGLRVPAKCRAGGCGFCHSKLVSGSFTIAGDDKRRLADRKFGYIHPCCSYPDSDLELIVPKA